MSNFIEILIKSLVFSYPITALVGLIANKSTFIVISGKNIKILYIQYIIDSLLYFALHQ